MNYEEALSYISRTHKFGSILGLDTIRELLARLGNPQKELKFVHIAGTNGKGSTSTMLSYILKEAGYKTGLYISPYLEKFTERIQLNNENIPEEELAEACEKVSIAIDSMLKDGYNNPTEFEIETAIAMVYYLKEKVDIVILEVGLGGRLDATNIIDTAEAAAIVSLSFDHMQYLGNTLSEIAYEKAGIIKDNYSVSLYAKNEQCVIDNVAKKCKEVNAELFVNNIDDIKVIYTDIDIQRVKYSKENSILDLDEFDMTLLGEHQAYNALNVLTICEILIRKGWKISSENITKAMVSVKFIGRFEVLNKEPIVVIDGGHNIDGITTFVKNVKTYFKGEKVNLFYGMLSDKQVDSSLDLLTSIAKRIYTLTPTDDRAVPAKEMKEFIDSHYEGIECVALEDFAEIVNHVDLTKTDEIYAFTGSLYMIGDARTILVKHIKANR